MYVRRRRSSGTAVSPTQRPLNTPDPFQMLGMPSSADLDDNKYDYIYTNHNHHHNHNLNQHHQHQHSQINNQNYPYAPMQQQVNHNHHQFNHQQQQVSPQPNYHQPATMMEDPVYLYDKHVYKRMLASEQRQSLFKSYFLPHNTSLSSSSGNNSKINSSSSSSSSSHATCFQQDFNEKDRRELAIWMNDVCLAEECQPDVFPLSILIVDKFLNFVKTKKQQLQLLGAVALLLASKLRQTSQIPAKHLIYYTQDLITLQELKTWELFVLTTLKWDLTFITPVDFLDILLKRLTIKDEQIISDIEEQAQRLIIQCCFDFKHALYPPSTIAWLCLLQAMQPYKLLLNEEEELDFNVAN